MKEQAITLKDKESVSLQIYSAIEKDESILLFFPAMGVRAEFYKPFATTLNQAGITCITSDLRGLDTSSIRPSAKVDFGYKEMIEDMEFVVQKVKEQFPSQPLYIGGHSLPIN